MDAGRGTTVHACEVCGGDVVIAGWADQPVRCPACGGATRLYDAAVEDTQGDRGALRGSSVGGWSVTVSFPGLLQ